MEYRKFDNTFVVRMDKGEEILDQLKILSEKENIKLAYVQAIGAVNDFTVGLYDTEKKEYKPNHFQGAYEIVSLIGTVTTKDGEFYAHLHMSAGDEQGQVYGGHLNRAVISATAELVIGLIDGRVERRFDDDIGLNLFRFI